MGVFDEDLMEKDMREIVLRRIHQSISEGSQMVGEEILLTNNNEEVKIQYEYMNVYECPYYYWRIKMYKKSKNRWIPIYKHIHRVPTHEEIRYDNFHWYISRLPITEDGYKVWKRWKYTKHPNRDLWISIFDLDEEQIGELDYFEEVSIGW